MIEAAALERVVDLAGAVRGDDHHRDMLGPERANLRHRDLEIGEDLEQERFELLIGTVNLVDEENGSPLVSGVDRLEEGPLEEKLLGKESCRTASRLSPPVASTVRR